jgi:hypothetical protein
VAAGALDYLYWQPYHFGPLNTWPFLLFLAILVEAGFDPEPAVRRHAVYAGLVFAVLSSVWVLSLPEVRFLNKQLAVGAVVAVAVAALCLALVRTSRPSGEETPQR